MARARAQRTYMNRLFMPEAVKARVASSSGPLTTPTGVDTAGEAAGGGPDERVTCVHHWLIEAPRSRMPATCKKCGAERTFRPVQETGYWIGTATLASSYTPKAKARRGLSDDAEELA